MSLVLEVLVVCLVVCLSISPLGSVSCGLLLFIASFNLLSLYLFLLFPFFFLSLSFSCLFHFNSQLSVSLLFHPVNLSLSHSANLSHSYSVNLSHSYSVNLFSFLFYQSFPIFHCYYGLFYCLLLSFLLHLSRSTQDPVAWR